MFSRPTPQKNSMLRIRLAMAFTRPSVAILAGTVLVAAAAAHVLSSLDYVEPGSWKWILLWGIGCVGLGVSATLGDPEGERQLFEELFQAQLGISKIRDTEVIRMLHTAVEYRLDVMRCEKVAKSAAVGLLSQTLEQVSNWLDGIARLAALVDESRRTAKQTGATMAELRSRIDGLEARVAEGPDAILKRELRETLAGRRHQLRLLQEDASLNERAWLRLEQAVSALGSISVQLSMVARKDLEIKDIGAIQSGITSEIVAIDEILVAYDRATLVGVPKQEMA